MVGSVQSETKPAEVSPLDSPLSAKVTFVTIHLEDWALRGKKEKYVSKGILQVTGLYA